MPNPVLSGCYPDPSVTRVGGDYYLVTSSFEYFPGLPVFHSTDLETFTQIGNAVDRADQLDLSGVPSSGGLYAATIRHHDGVFFIVCTLVGSPGTGGHFLLTSTDPAGPWSDPVWLDGDGIDPSLFFDDDDGRTWFTATRPARTPAWPDQTEVWLREFDPVAQTLVGDEHVLWTGAVVGAVWAEGPHLYRRDGWYYLLASEGGTEFHHAVTVARSRVVTGGYTGDPANPVLTHRTLGHGHPVTNVGHADLVETPDGGWAAVLLGSRGLDSTLGRESFRVPVVWEHGWPVFAPGVGQVLLGEPATPARAMPGPLEWSRPRTGPLAAIDGDTVTITGPGFAGVRQRHPTFAFGARVESGADATGLMVRQSDVDHLRLTTGAAGVVATRTAHGVTTTLATAPVADLLEIRGHDGLVELWADGALLATVDGAFLGSAEAGGFLGVWLALVADAGGRFGGVFYAG